jgi:hypothetical protein
MATKGAHMATQIAEKGAQMVAKDAMHEAHFCQLEAMT